MNESHRINVLGKELVVKTSASAETVREIEAYVNGKVAEVAAAVKGGGDSQVIAALTLMNIAEAYLSLAKEHADLRQSAQETVHRMVNKIGDHLDRG